MQERRVERGRGGLGYAQWTGRRRRMFEAWAKERGLDVHSEEANRGFALWELANTRVGQATIAAVRKTGSLEEGVMKAGQIYETPAGTTPTFLPGYGGRLEFARRALESLTSPEAIVASTLRSRYTPEGDAGSVGGSDLGGGLMVGGGLHKEFEALTHIIRSTGEHLNDLGYSARSARQGLSGNSSGVKAAPANASPTQPL
jgi:hypothetical protein